MTQTNVQQGKIKVLAGEALSDYDDYLVEVYNDSGTLKCRRPTANDAQALYVLEEGVASGEYATLLPLEPGKQYRVEFEGSGDAAAVVCLADGAGVAADKGKLRALPTGTPGTYRGLGWLEATAADGDLALIRFLPQGNVTVS